MPLSEQQAWDIVQKGPAHFGFYHGEKRFGSLHLDRNDGQWYFIENWRRWKESNFNKDALKTEKLGKPVDLRMLRVLNELPDNNVEQGRTINMSSWNESIVVVLGAGASFDFTADEIKYRPPMVRDLFSNAHLELRKLYGEVDSIFQSARGIDDLEKFLQRKWDMLQDSYNPILLRKLVGVQYYLHHLFFRLSLLSRNADHNNYRTLVQHMAEYAALKRERVRFIVVSFNYDTLFENAVKKELEWEFNQLSEYTDPDRFIQVYKVHGSANWARVQVGIEKSRSHEQWFSNHANQIIGGMTDLTHILDRFDQSPVVLVQEEIDFLKQAFHDLESYHWQDLIPNINLGNSQFASHKEIRSELFGTRVFWPEILIPYSQKDSFLLPQSTIAQLNTFLEKADKVLCIGWKGNERLFKDLLAQKERNYLWVTKEEVGKSDIQEGACGSLAADMKFYLNGFSEFMTEVNEKTANLFQEFPGLPFLK